jgi:hypothetical protein
MLRSLRESLCVVSAVIAAIVATSIHWPSLWTSPATSASSASPSSPSTGPEAAADPPGSSSRAERVATLALTEPLEPIPVGLRNLPFAPAELSGCDEMMFYGEQFGLPDYFRGIGWRESSCRNMPHVRTFCCHGYWQLWVGFHLLDDRIAPLYAACEISSVSDVNQDTPLSKQKQACGAAATFSVVGTEAWRMTR